MIQWNGQEVIDAVHERIKANMLGLARAVVADAERRAPKRTGHLASTIGFDWNESTYSVVFTVDAPYGMFQEYGTRNMMPHPYIRPALNTIGPQYGFNFEISFTSTIQTDTKLLAHGPTFQMHKSLTAKQKAHVRAHLKPVSEHFHHLGSPYKGALTNVGRARVHARRKQF